MPPTSLAYLPADDPARRRPEQELNLADAPAYQLFFSCFMGDVDLSLDGVSFRTEFGWVSTLGFAIGFYNAVRKLPASGLETVLFQEDDEWIRLSFHGGIVNASCSYSDSVQDVSHHELLELSLSALKDLIGYLSERYPALTENVALRDTLAAVSLQYPREERRAR